MHPSLFSVVLLALLTSPTFGQDESHFVDLFATGDLSQWYARKKEGWSLEDGVVKLHTPRSGPLISKKKYKNFELKFDWKISAGSNSGVIYRSQKGRGFEYQLLDDENHRAGKRVMGTTASLYDLEAPNELKQCKPVEEWNTARIVADGTRIEHWLNGKKVVAIKRAGPEWEKRYQNSKYVDNGLNNFGNVAAPIILQDHGGVVEFRNVMLREIEREETASRHPDFPMMFGKVKQESKFVDEDWYIWGGSMVKGPDGKFHLLYSRWPRELGHKAWVTHSEIANAVSDSPTGPYQHVDVALTVRGRDLWDGMCTHNPTVHKFDGKYYLYYMGNTGDREPTEKLNFQHRNNQRIGVAVADHPGGPWNRFDKPLIDVSENDDAPDALMTSNPSILRRSDGKFVLVYKAVGKKRKGVFGGPVVHMAAISDSPTGPFIKQPGLAFVIEGSDFPAEDPYIWSQGEDCWAIVNDHKGAFTKTGQDSLALFHSKDGLEWKVSDNPLVLNRKVQWQGGKNEKFHRLERPQLYLENGVPKVLFCAGEKTNEKLHSFNVPIPIEWK
jgi:hypothetical protein